MDGDYILCGDNNYLDSFQAMNYGLVENIVSDVREYILGGSKVPYIPYQEDGNWEPFLPRYESQSVRFETHGCSVWGSQNQSETLYKRLYGIEPNYSERFTYLLAGVVPGKGADPQLVYESIRKNGVVNESEFPMTKTLDDYMDKSDITGSLLAKGQNWLYTHDFLHEWLWKKGERPENWKPLLKEALQTSPIAVSVTAWRQENGLYVSGTGGNNHWCLLYRIDTDGVMWVFDSYDHSKKPLHPEHYIRRAKRIWLNKKTPSAMRRHIGILEKIVNMLTQKKTLLDVCKANLGQDASPKDAAKDEVACAETVTTLLKQVYPEVPVITGTWTLYEYLNNPKNGFKKVAEPKAETIIISPTGSGRGIGHVGIFDEQGLIMSNNSFGLLRGQFTQNYTLPLWQSKFGVKQGMPVMFFHHV
jgi:hypothetical protein